MLKYIIVKKLKEEFDLKTPLWAVILIVIFELLPISNIITFIIFTIWYIYMSNRETEWLETTQHFSLRGENYIGKVVKAIKNFLNKKI